MLKSFLDLFLQPHCALCDRSAPKQICLYCEKQLQKLESNNSQALWQGELPVFIWGSYGGLLKRAIAGLKYEKKAQIGELFGYWLGEKWLKSNCYKPYQKLTVVPIPLHEKKLQIRGYNQAEIIAQTFCQVTRYKLKAQGLARIKNTEALFGLNVQQRQKEIKDCLVLGKDFIEQKDPNPVLLLDDIYTTGTTVKEAKKILQKYQINVIGVVALASSKITEETTKRDNF